MLIDSIKSPRNLPCEIKFISSDIEIPLFEMALKELKKRRITKVEVQDIDNESKGVSGILKEPGENPLAPDRPQYCAGERLVREVLNSICR